MNRKMAATFASSVIAGTPSPSVSEEGLYIQHVSEETWDVIQRSETLGVKSLFADLEELWWECREPNWDGYEAVRISRATIEEARRFVRSLPAGIARPTLGAEPDGHITLEWYASPRRILSVSISSDADLHYAAMIGPSRFNGTEPFLGDCPGEVLELAQRVQQ